MKDKFYFLNFTEEKIQNKRYLCVYILNVDKHAIFRIYLKYTDDDYDRLCEFEQFEDITEKIQFVIKRDGKLSLDINI